MTHNNYDALEQLLLLSDEIIDLANNFFSSSKVSYSRLEGSPSPEIVIYGYIWSNPTEETLLMQEKLREMYIKWSVLSKRLIEEYLPEKLNTFEKETENLSSLIELKCMPGNPGSNITFNSFRSKFGIQKSIIRSLQYFLLDNTVKDFKREITESDIIHKEEIIEACDEILYEKKSDKSWLKEKREKILTLTNEVSFCIDSLNPLISLMNLILQTKNSL